MKPDVNPNLVPLLRPMSELKLDPNNPRKHTDRGLKGLVESLSKHGQQKPIVVKDGVIVAGNGTFQAAQRLCWDQIAAVEFDRTSAGHFGLADNRSAELSTWDYEKLSQQLSLFEVSGGSLWNDEELGNLKTADFTPAPVSEHDPTTFGLEKISLTIEENKIVMEAIARVKANMGNPEFSNGLFVAIICAKYLGGLVAEGVQQPIIEKPKKVEAVPANQMELPA
jgi:hypothetical protein